MPEPTSHPVHDLADLAFSPTAWLFEGATERTGSTLFMVRTPPGRFIELHTHPYAETFLLLEGHGRWTIGDAVVEMRPERILVVPPETLHGVRNIGDVPLLVVSVHDGPKLEQTFTDREPA
jgi:mannose-6-phosphate isomerase-like protein (cupin superfamily)